jgi:flagellar hook-basal body complex protein FliE
MALIGSTVGVGGPRPFLPPQVEPLQRTGKPGGGTELGGAAGVGGVAPQKFDSVIDQALSAVEAQQAKAAATTRSVLLGDNARLHESMIAMQEASLSFSLMIEVRNKVVEGYQEMMRMPV